MLELIIGLLVGIAFGVSVAALMFGRKTDALIEVLEWYVELVGGLRP